jgi:hypothetical protein
MYDSPLLSLSLSLFFTFYCYLTTIISTTCLWSVLSRSFPSYSCPTPTTTTHHPLWMYHNLPVLFDIICAQCPSHQRWSPAFSNCAIIKQVSYVLQAVFQLKNLCWCAVIILQWCMMEKIHHEPAKAFFCHISITNYYSDDIKYNSRTISKCGPK